MDPQLKKLFDHEKGRMRTVTKAGVSQFFGNREWYGDENEVDCDIIKQLQRRYPPSLDGAVMRVCGLAQLEAKVEIEMNAVLE